MNLGLQNFTTGTRTPMGGSVGFYSSVYMNMALRRTQFKSTVDTHLIFPFFCILIRNMGCDFCLPVTIFADAPVSGRIGLENIIVGSGYRTTEITNVTGFIAVRAVDMGLLVHGLTASDTEFPMCIPIELLFTTGLVSRCQNKSAKITGFRAAFGENMLLVTDKASAIRAACPVIEIVLLPLIAQRVIGSGLLVAEITYFLMFIFIEVGEIGVDMFTGGADRLAGFCTAILADKLLLTFFHTGSFCQNLTGFPVVGAGFFIIAFGAKTAVFAVVSLCPAAESVAACFLDACLAA